MLVNVGYKSNQRSIVEDDDHDIRLNLFLTIMEIDETTITNHGNNLVASSETETNT